MNIRKILLVLVLLFIPISAYAEFKYLDKVRIVDGFYIGETGALQEKIADRYRVKLMPVGKVVTVSEDDIERCTRPAELR